MKIALAVVMRASPPAAPEPNKIIKTSAAFRKLSLNAAKNWHQNSGAKRLDSIRGGGMPIDESMIPIPGNRFCGRIGRHPTQSSGGAPLAKKLGGLLAAQRIATCSDRSLSMTQTTQITGRFGFLIGFQGDGAPTEAKSNDEHDGEHRNPHGWAPRRRYSARGKSEGGNALSGAGFLSANADCW